MKKIAVVTLLTVLAGCATADSKLRKLHEGMNQGEVEHVMGPANDIKYPSENAQGHMVNIWMYNLGKEYHLFWVDDRLAAWALAEKWTPEDMRNLQLDFTLNDASRQYIKKLPGIETVAKTAALPIDGTWKRRGFDVKLATGAGELVFTGDNPFNGKPFFQKIERTAPGKYTCQNLGFSDNKRETWYAQCEMALKSPTQLIIEYKPDASRGEDQGVTEYYDLGAPADQAAFDAEVKAAGL